MTDTKKKPSTRQQIIVGIFWALVIFIAFQSCQSDGPSAYDQFNLTARERFNTIEAAFKEEGDTLDSITCLDGDCTSVVYFNFNTLRSDLEEVIRGNTATFSNFKIKELGTSHVSIFATVNGNTVLVCNGNSGMVQSCE